MYLLDTNSCIDFLDGRSESLAKRMEAAFGRLAISTISLGELLVGSRSSLDPDADARRVRAFAASLDVRAFDVAAAEAYGQTIRAIGVKRKSFDRLIGVQALTLGLVLVTRNLRDFSDVPGLKVETWHS